MEGGGVMKIVMCPYNICVVIIAVVIPLVWIASMVFYDSLLCIFCPAIAGIATCVPLWLKPPWEYDLKKGDNQNEKQ